MLEIVSPKKEKEQKKGGEEKKDASVTQKGECAWKTLR